MEPATRIDCLDPETLAAYLDGLLAHEAVGRADRHIDTCRSCRVELSALAETHSFPAGSGGAFVVIDGTPIEGRLGRYEVLRELGRGSMGVVVRAYDPELARAVAVKILSPRLWAGGTGDDARARLRREAQAMARLTHPNVVTVYDVATHDDAIFIAMELVEGETLRDRVRAHRSYTWRDTLAVCIRAGRGLAAAHAAKLVHRDYKPENVLCGTDGRVVVSDFGLARLDDDRPPIDRAAPALVTTLAGTPAYMAPEVVRGEPATPASDQFSFCVATYEAHYGERPFAGDTLEELRDHIARGVTRDATGGHVPPWLRAALLRGLASDPAARFASMTELLDHLEAGASTRRRWIGITAALALVVVIVAGAVVATRSSGPTCAIDESTLAGAWDADRRHALETALHGRPADRIARITAALDTYSHGWLATRRDACEATRVRGDQSERVLDARVACLERGRRELDALVTLLAGDPTLADRGVEAVYGLRDPATCTGEVEAQPADPAMGAQRARWVIDLDRASALLAAGKSQEAIAIASEIIASLAGKDAFATLAEALLLRGRAETALGKLEAAETTFAEALTAAERGRADPLVAAIWVELVQTTGSQKHRFEAATANVRAAEAAFTRVEPGRALRARFTYVVGGMLLASGKFEEARVQLDRALVANRDARPGERGLVHAALCDAHRKLRHLADARTQCQAAIELLTAAFGADHPKLAPTYNVLGGLELDDNHPDLARGHFEHSAAIFERSGLESDRAFGLALSNQAVVWMRSGDVARARPLFERARQVFATHHPDHPQRVFPLQGLASLALETDDFRTAVRMYEEALAVIETVYGKDHDSRITVLYNLALSHERLADLDRAAAIADDAIEQAGHPGRESWSLLASALDLRASIADQRKGDPGAIALRERALLALDHTDDRRTRALIDSRIGNAKRRAGTPALALPHLERAVAYHDRDRTDPYLGAGARFALARALWEAGRRGRAIELAKASGVDYAAAKSGPSLPAHREEVARWLHDRGVK